MKGKKTKFFIFWSGQAVSQLGSSMTSFSLTIWIFIQTQSTMAVSIGTLCFYVPYILASILSGGIVDRFSKKTILVVSDAIAALSTVCIAFSMHAGLVSVWQIYAVNAIVGFMSAFQSPASAVVTGMLVPDHSYEKASGLNSLSHNLTMIVSPMLAGVLIASLGIEFVVVIDFLSFIFAETTLLFFVDIKEVSPQISREESGFFAGFQEGIVFLRKKTDPCI